MDTTPNDNSKLNPDQAEALYRGELFHLSDILSVTHGVKVSRIVRPAYPYGEPAPKRSPVLKGTPRGMEPSDSPFSNEGTNELLKFMVGDDRNLHNLTTRQQAMKEAKEALFKQYPFLKDISPPTSYKTRGLLSWLEEQEENLEPRKWLSVLPITKKTILAHEQSMLTAERAAKSVAILSGFGASAASINPDNIKTFGGQSGYYLSVESNSDHQAEARFNNLEKHFKEIGLEPYIERIPGAGDDVISPSTIQIHTNRFKPDELERLIDYSHGKQFSHALDVTSKRAREFTNLTPRDTRIIKKLAHPELALAIAALFQATRRPLSPAAIKETSTKNGYKFTLPTSGEGDRRDKRLLLEHHLSEAKLGDSIVVKERTDPQTHNILLTVRVITDESSPTDHEMDIPQFTAHVQQFLKAQQRGPS